MLTRFGLYGGMFGGGAARRQRRRSDLADRAGLVSIVTYVLSFLLIRAISRYREYAADRGAALITGAPEHLMSALQKITGEIDADPAARPARGRGDERVLHHPDERRPDGSPSSSPRTRRLEKRLARLAEIAREMGRPVA